MAQYTQELMWIISLYQEMKVVEGWWVYWNKVWLSILETKTVKSWQQYSIIYNRKQIEENRQRFRKKERERRKEGWQTKVMHGQHVRQTKDFAAQNSWQWLRRGSLKRQTESLIIAAPNQALGTNYRNAKIEHPRESATCRMYKTRDETVTHIISDCSKLSPDRLQSTTWQSGKCSTLEYHEGAWTVSHKVMVWSQSR